MNIKRLLFAGISGLLIAIAPVIASNAQAARAQSFVHTDRAGEYFRYTHTRNDHDILFFRARRPITTVVTDRDFLIRNRVIERNRFMNRNDFNDRVFPRRVVIIDRDFPANNFVIQNQNTGPFSVNQVNLRVRHSFFDQIANEVDVNRNVNVDVNTGNNTVSFNTISGPITTGDVSISIR